MFLDDDEIEQLTKRRRRPAQSKALSFMGIEHKMRPDGSLVVLRAHVERMLGGGIVPPRKERKWEPNFDWMKEANRQTAEWRRKREKK